MDMTVDPKQARKVIDDVKPILGQLIAEGMVNHPMASAAFEWLASKVEDKLEDQAIQYLEAHNAAAAAKGA